MKKVLIIIAMLTILLCGCQGNNDTNTSDYKNSILKAQEIAVISESTSDIIDTISNKKDIEDFIAALEIDKWTLKKLPDDAKAVGSFGLSQEETIKSGESETNGTLYDVGKITLYNSPYIDIEIAGFGMTFGVSQETAEYLKSFF